MTAPNRIILTAARADRSSFGCTADRIYTVFDACLLGVLPHATTWRAVFDETKLIACSGASARTVRRRRCRKPGSAPRCASCRFSSEPCG